MFYSGKVPGIQSWIAKKCKQDIGSKRWRTKLLCRYRKGNTEPDHMAINKVMSEEVADQVGVFWYQASSSRRTHRSGQGLQLKPGKETVSFERGRIPQRTILQSCHRLSDCPSSARDEYNGCGPPHCSTLTVKVLWSGDGCLCRRPYCRCAGRCLWWAHVRFCTSRSKTLFVGFSSQDLWITGNCIMLELYQEQIPDASFQPEYH